MFFFRSTCSLDQDQHTLVDSGYIFRSRLKNCDRISENAVLSLINNVSLQIISSSDSSEDSGGSDDGKSGPLVRNCPLYC